MSERILITGAEGFVGRALTRTLLSRLEPGDRIFCGQHTLKIAASDGVEVLPLDVTDSRATREAVRRLRPTCVVHLAAIAAVQDASRDRERTWAVNFGGTKTLAEAILSEAPRARLIFVGTSESYGGTFRERAGALDEAAALDPTNPYAVSKAAADLLVGQLARDGLRAVRFRPFNHTGPGQTDRFVVPAFASQIAKIEAGCQEPVMRVGNLEAQRDFLDVRDVVEAYVSAIFRADLPNGVILNLASGEPRRIGDILRDLCARSTHRIEIELDADRLRPSDTPVAIGNAERARKMLDWVPKTSWATTIDEVLGFWREQVSSERAS